MTNLQQIFLEETIDLFEEIEEGMILLERSLDVQVVHPIFRNIHTIKGGAAMAHLEGLANYAHNLENLLSRIREGHIGITSRVINVLLEGLDVLRRFVAAAEEGDISGETIDHQITQSNLEKIQALCDGDVPQIAIQKDSSPSPEVIRPAKVEQTYIAHICFVKQFMVQGGDVTPFLQQVRKQFSGVLLIPHVSQATLLAENLGDLSFWWSARFYSAEKQKRLEQQLQKMIHHYIHDYPELGNDAIRFELVTATVPDAPENQQQLDGTLLPQSVITNEPQIASTEHVAEKEALDSPVAPRVDLSPAQPGIQSMPSPIAAKSSSGNIRVSIERLDQLINLVGENVINQTRLESFQQQLEGANEQFGEQLLTLLDDSETIIRDMQEQAMGLRMVEISGTFQALKRIVRDYTSHSNKKIDVIFQGENSEIDKTIIDQLKGILTHIIRNAMDHGIESAEERLTVGKHEQGRIKVSARHESGLVVITVEDDGKGIDVEKIYAKALSNGLVTEEDDLDDQEKLSLLFEAGLSTSEKVTNSSGRGVGMDAVKADIEQLRGSISIDTDAGQGSTFTIKLPLTLAIIDGMIIGAGNHKFAIPLLSIVESMRSQPGQIQHIKGNSEVIELRGEFIPLVRLHDLFNLQSINSDPNEGLLVIAEENNRKVCLQVDEIHGQNSIVIKDIESNFIKIDYISGATILGDGELAPIINIPSLFSIKHKRAVT